MGSKRHVSPDGADRRTLTLTGTLGPTSDLVDGEVRFLCMSEHGEGVGVSAAEAIQKWIGQSVPDLDTQIDRPAEIAVHIRIVRP